ncbi:hypothetical protein MBOE_04650 [Mycolicibacterium boenickei]|uniref:Uncharacterized protein n=1 Tax=Mycolicibacterium boenickei TaxID=146017 RepID=A0ABM7IPV6_9MYCO|nr:hypothetical protein MBOE_04650 [Mycolicibacterium boenickei]
MVVRLAEVASKTCIHLVTGSTKVEAVSCTEADEIAGSWASGRGAAMGATATTLAAVRAMAAVENGRSAVCIKTPSEGTRRQ